jgi:hypothetical protein
MIVPPFDVHVILIARIMVLVIGHGEEAQVFGELAEIVAIGADRKLSCAFQGAGGMKMQFMNCVSRI